MDLPDVVSRDDVSEDEIEAEPTIEFTEEPLLNVREPPPGVERQQLWHDPADDNVSVSLKSSKRMRKLARGKGGEDTVNGNDLQAKLREQCVLSSQQSADSRFERLHPKPEWASHRVDTKVPTMQRLLSTTASFVSSGHVDGRPPLPTTTLDIQRLRNANSVAGDEGSTGGQAGIVDLAWHPSAKMPVLATAGTDRRVRFYNVSRNLHDSC